MANTDTQSDTNNPMTFGLHHLGLTIPNIAETAAFFTEHLNFTTLGAREDYPALFISDGSIMLTLWQAQGNEPARPFDRHRNIGLHHFALKVANLEVLETLYYKLQKVSDVAFEFGPQAMGESPVDHMICTVPGGLRVEFLAARSQI